MPSKEQNERTLADLLDRQREESARFAQKYANANYQQIEVERARENHEQAKALYRIAKDKLLEEDEA